MVTEPSSAREGLRIVFLGTPAFAVPTLRHLVDSRHHVCGVVTQPDRPRGRGQRVSDSPVKALALAHALPVLQPERLREPEVQDAVAAWTPDLGVVAAYGKLIPESLLTLPRFGMINVHASLLPKYRGAAPVHRAVIDGERETGVTIMRVVKALDAGAMFANARRPIDPDETSEAVERDLAAIGARLLVRVVDAIEAGTAHEEPQDDRVSTYAPKITREDGAIDWRLPATRIHDRVRGLYPWPHASTYLDGRRVIVLATRIDADPSARVAAGVSGTPAATDVPGTILAVTPDAVQAATGHGGRLTILVVQPEGRRPMAVRDFLAGHPISPGTVFTASA